MIGQTAQRLLKDIFPGADLFRGLPQIRKRIVKWGASASPLALPHSAIVISEQALLDRMQDWPLVGHAVSPACLDTRVETQSAEWSILSSRPLPDGSQDIHFGSRVAEAAAVKLKPGCDEEASWVESLANGWLFLLPDAEYAWLLAVGASAESLLAESSLIARQILSVTEDALSFACHPRIAEPLCGPGWLACGSAALGFDPLCGDGSGYAAREAILASAVVRAAAQGGDSQELTAHYRARLLAGFQKHLVGCAEFYRCGHSGAWWDEQRNATEKGLEWCRTRLINANGFKFRLSGFSLQAVGSPS
jgi:hypothetical protein